jgi:cell division protein FtsW
VSLALACFGVVMVASSSIAIGEGLGVGPFYFLEKHLMFLAGGCVLAAWAMRTELKWVEQRGQWLLLGCFVLLLLVFVPGIGRSVNGARRWIYMGLSNFQVVEAVKVLYIVWLASYLKRYSEDVTATWSAMLKPLGAAAVLVGLLLMQPDFGSSSLLLAITAGMLVLGGVNMPRMFGPVLVGLPVLAVIAIAEPYRMRRLTTFLDPWADPFNSGYQLTNALMAVGRGEWFGVGLGASVQKLSYLPEAHTDFIMAVIAEELGFVGVCAVVSAYALLAGRAFWIGLQCVEMRRHFAGYVAFGIALWMSLQSFVSIGVNLGLLPTKGLTLPMISSGGSSVLMTCAALGLLLRVSYELDRARRQVALRRTDASAATGAMPPDAPMSVAPSRVDPPASAPGSDRGRSRARIEPVLGVPAALPAVAHALRRRP